ncbi:hypothetical protein [Dactylosporangium sp. NPDC049140]|uniref:hypothetical protein n=1 Tax=Dactylosporangium sp. NPDC049140 TaxID=3155647 RepID=UPI003409BE78
MHNYNFALPRNDATRSSPAILPALFTAPDFRLRRTLAAVVRARKVGRSAARLFGLMPCPAINPLSRGAERPT